MLVLGGGCCCISEIPLHRDDSQLGTRYALGSYGEASPGSIYAHPWGGALLTSPGARIQLPQGTLSKEVTLVSFRVSFRSQKLLDHRDCSSPRFIFRLQTLFEVKDTHRSRVFRHR